MLSRRIVGGLRKRFQFGNENSEKYWVTFLIELVLYKRNSP